MVRKFCCPARTYSNTFFFFCRVQVGIAVPLCRVLIVRMMCANVHILLNGVVDEIWWDES